MSIFKIKKLNLRFFSQYQKSLRNYLIKNKENKYYL